MTRFQPAEMDTLVHWISERESVRQKKEAGLPRPWTEDALLRDYRWCNVRRMDDAVSAALMRSWYRQNADARTALTAACLGRLVNWPASLMAITGGEPFELRHLARAPGALERRQRLGMKVFTGAYIVPGRAGESKTDTVVSHAERVEQFAHLYFQKTMHATWERMLDIPGLGSFLVGQMVADVAHLEIGRCWWTDRTSWAPVGPGSARGINRLLGRHKDRPVAQAEFEPLLHSLMGELRPRVAAIWEDRDLHAMDVQNCLCEFDKYRRLQLGEGQVRARYDGAARPAGFF